ncbi:hypothetical protein AKJ48_00720 [candidate division MSBL1 archaeon SCGC-AAA261O19]|uniref:Uncharacterized protein n=2 Tax=candidate division MSBL1 TaxID=215777 RepID=A0A133V2F1_9EURY|nr:hypothetical protein AKJ42_00105 [candidate division MSBL1 archaeon SCGC-AAA261C02]KXB05001.1 hypothetical protein AKJ48_00720 [candidate division MSBL1 archaeon SCGC-AAA261O19]
MEKPELDWIVEKASELLSDKVEDSPLKEEDVDLAFEIFADPRLKKVSKSFDSEEEYTKAVNYVRVKLHEIYKKLNEEHWSEE